MTPPVRHRSPQRRSRVLLVAAAALALAAPGCVSRKLFLRTDPPGARVILDGKYVGTTPYVADYGSYGTRAVELELPGYARTRQLLPIDLPWWQIFPLDFVTDLLVPFTINDDRSFDFTLVKVDPEAGTWEDAYAAYEREQALQHAELQAGTPTGAAPEGGP